MNTTKNALSAETLMKFAEAMRASSFVTDFMPGGIDCELEAVHGNERDVAALRRELDALLRSAGAVTQAAWRVVRATGQADDLEDAMTALARHDPVLR